MMRRNTHRRYTHIKHNIIDDDTDILGVNFRIYLTIGLFFIAGSLALFGFLILFYSFQSESVAIAASMIIPFAFFLFTQFFLYFFLRFKCKQCHTRSVRVLTYIVGHKANCLNCSNEN